MAAIVSESDITRPDGCSYYGLDSILNAGDVHNSTPANGDVLTYSESECCWYPTAQESGSGSSSSAVEICKNGESAHAHALISGTLMLSNTSVAGDNESIICLSSDSSCICSGAYINSIVKSKCNQPIGYKREAISTDSSIASPVLFADTYSDTVRTFCSSSGFDLDANFGSVNIIKDCCNIYCNTTDICSKHYSHTDCSHYIPSNDSCCILCLSTQSTICDALCTICKNYFTIPENSKLYRKESYFNYTHNSSICSIKTREETMCGTSGCLTVKECSHNYYRYGQCITTCSSECLCMFSQKDISIYSACTCVYSTCYTCIYSACDTCIYSDCNTDIYSTCSTCIYSTFIHMCSICDTYIRAKCVMYVHSKKNTYICSNCDTCIHSSNNTCIHSSNNTCIHSYNRTYICSNRTTYIYAKCGIFMSTDGNMYVYGKSSTSICSNCRIYIYSNNTTNICSCGATTIYSNDNTYICSDKSMCICSCNCININSNNIGICGTSLHVGNLPITDPLIVDQIWNDGGILKISAG